MTRTLEQKIALIYSIHTECRHKKFATEDTCRRAIYGLNQRGKSYPRFYVHFCRKCKQWMMKAEK